MRHFKYVLLAGFLFISSCQLQNREVKDNLITSKSKKIELADSSNVDIPLFIVDTIEIDNPILIRFEENIEENISVKLILTQKNTIDSFPFNREFNYRNFFYSSGYLLYDANEFRCLTSNLYYKFPDLKNTSFYIKLEDDLRSAEKDTVYIPFDRSKDKPKIHNGWEYREIYPRKFIFCLVKGIALRMCEYIGNARIENMDNVYFKVLVPITW